MLIINGFSFHKFSFPETVPSSTWCSLRVISSAACFTKRYPPSLALLIQSIYSYNPVASLALYSIQ